MIPYKIFKSKLDNGLNVLILPKRDVKKVSTQLWYDVGSKDERSGEKGLAHLLEHMIFKGTKKLSESDINVITQKFSGHCNAFTSFDYTGYLFDFPSQNWKISLELLSDCMRNCIFKQDHLNSELKAVIQELKMYQDDYQTTLIESLLIQIFEDHPYHYPIIGYKQDLFDVNSEKLKKFYDEYYWPNNANLIIVGDVNENEALDLANKNFGSIRPKSDLTKSTFYSSIDIKTSTTTIYRDVSLSHVLLAWKIPGSKKLRGHFWQLISTIFSQRSSRLFKELVEDKALVTDIDSFIYDLFDESIFFVYFQPKKPKAIDKIINIIYSIIKLIAQNGFTKLEIESGVKKIKLEYLTMFENTQTIAYELGKDFLITPDENYLLRYLDNFSNPDLQNGLQYEVEKYLHPSLCQIAKLASLSKDDLKLWVDFQNQQDLYDQKILEGKERHSSIEPAVFADHVKPDKAQKFNFPEFKKVELNNGLQVSYLDTKGLDKTHIILDFKYKHFQDPIELQGLTNLTYQLLAQGTTKYSAQELADYIDSKGISLAIAPSRIELTCLSENLEEALKILTHIINDSVFESTEINKVKDRILADIKSFWDEPYDFISLVARQKVYGKDSIYSRFQLGDKKSLKNITKHEILNYHKNYLSGFNSKLIVVGNFQRIDLEKILDHTLAKLPKVQVPEIIAPSIPKIKKSEYFHKINRDQTTLGYVGLSSKLLGQDYDALVVFDQIFTGGVLRGMSSMLFQLRERSGLFYTIGGSLVWGADKYSGLIFLKTLVSNDRLAEAENAIEDLIGKAISQLNEADFEAAKNAIANSMLDKTENYRNLALSQLFLMEYSLTAKYFDEKLNSINKLTIDQVKEVVQRCLDTNKLIKIKVGRPLLGD